MAPIIGSVHPYFTRYYVFNFGERRSLHEFPDWLGIIKDSLQISHNISSRAKIGWRRGPIRAADGTRLVWIAR